MLCDGSRSEYSSTAPLSQSRTAQRSRVKTPAARSTPLLPPRLQRTLERLLAGESDKEIAQKLGISRHTVHEYVGDLYRRFGVSGRGELMAMLLRNRS